jgi:hypothetical protein
MARTGPKTFLDRVERWLLIAILAAAALLIPLVMFALWHARQQQTAPLTGEGRSVESTSLSIVVVFGDGAHKRSENLPFAQGMTVLDAMNLARAAPDPIAFRATGSGATALITQIDTVANESGAARPDSKAWQYWINSSYGTMSVGAAVLHPGDRITWAFRKYEADPGPPPK